jgi:hypothetical protein
MSAATRREEIPKTAAIRMSGVDTHAPTAAAYIVISAISRCTAQSTAIQKPTSLLTETLLDLSARKQTQNASSHCVLISLAVVRCRQRTQNLGTAPVKRSSAVPSAVGFLLQRLS